MYTLILLVIVFARDPGRAPQLAMTSFPVADAKVCGNAAGELSKQSTASIRIHTYCVPRSN